MATYEKYGEKYKKWGENKDFDPSDFEIVDSKPEDQAQNNKPLDEKKYSLGGFKFSDMDFTKKDEEQVQETPEQRMERSNREMADERYQAPDVPERTKKAEDKKAEDKKPEAKEKKEDKYVPPVIDDIKPRQGKFVSRLNMTGDEEKAQRRKQFISKVQGEDKMSPAEMKMMDERKMQASGQIEQARSNPSSRADLSRLEDSRKLGTEMKWDESRQARRKNFMYKMK